MLQMVLDEAFTIQVLFVDAVNDPVAVADPSVEIYFFHTGVKSTLVASTAMAPSAPAEVGRYIYLYTPSSALLDVGDIVYVDITGTVALQTFREMQKYLIVNAACVAGTPYVGLTARFVN